MSNMENSSANTPAQSDGSIQDVSQQSGGNITQSSVSSQPPVHQGKIFYTLHFFLFCIRHISRGSHKYLVSYIFARFFIILKLMKTYVLHIFYAYKQVHY